MIVDSLYIWKPRTHICVTEPLLKQIYLIFELALVSGIALFGISKGNRNMIYSYIRRRHRYTSSDFHRATTTTKKKLFFNFLFKLFHFFYLIFYAVKTY